MSNFTLSSPDIPSGGSVPAHFEFDGFACSGRQSNAGRPRIPLRTMSGAALPQARRALRSAVKLWSSSDSPNMQYFSGMAYFEPRLPCDATTLIKFRRLLGEEGVEELLSQTITAAVSLNLIPAAARPVVVAPCAGEAVAHPRTPKLLETARSKLVAAAQDAGIELKQTFAKEGRLLRFKAGRYAHAKQFKRMRRVIKRQSTVVGRLVREIERKASALQALACEALGGALDKAKRIAEQSKSPKHHRQSQALRLARPGGRVHCQGQEQDALRVRCESGHCHDAQHNLSWGPGVPGQTVRRAHTQGAIGAGRHLDAGDRCSAKHRLCRLGPGGWMRITRRAGRACPGGKLLRRRQAVEPIIGHLKSDHRMDRCPLKGELGDSVQWQCCGQWPATPSGGRGGSPSLPCPGRGGRRAYPGIVCAATTGRRSVAA